MDKRRHKKRDRKNKEWKDAGINGRTGGDRKNGRMERDRNQAIERGTNNNRKNKGRHRKNRD